MFSHTLNAKTYTFLRIHIPGLALFVLFYQSFIFRSRIFRSFVFSKYTSLLRQVSPLSTFCRRAQNSMRRPEDWDPPLGLPWDRPPWPFCFCLSVACQLGCCPCVLLTAYPFLDPGLNERIFTDTAGSAMMDTPGKN